MLELVLLILAGFIVGTFTIGALVGVVEGAHRLCTYFGPTVVRRTPYGLIKAGHTFLLALAFTVFVLALAFIVYTFGAIALITFGVEIPHPGITT